MNRRTFLLGSLASALATGCSSSSRPVLNFYNWSNFIAPDTISGFEAATGIRVNYEEFSSADVMYAKLKIGVTGYDLVVAPDYMVRRMIRQDLLSELQPSIDPSGFLSHLHDPPYDPGFRYSVPYLWGTTGVAYNRRRVPEGASGWSLLWEPRLKGRITILDEKRDAIAAALFLLGEDPNSTDPAVLARAKSKLLEQRPLVRRYTSDFTDDLIRGETWAALGWSGDVAQAQAANHDIEYLIPEEGAFLFVDSLCIPKGAPHPNNARRFVDYFLQPGVCAAITNATGYANPVSEARQWVNASLLDNPLGYPPSRILERLSHQEDLGAHEQAWDKLWEEVKR